MTLEPVPTEYYCQMFKIPASWLSQKRHLIRVAKKIIIFTLILIFYLIFFEV